MIDRLLMKQIIFLIDFKTEKVKNSRIVEFDCRYSTTFLWDFEFCRWKNRKFNLIVQLNEKLHPENSTFVLMTHKGGQIALTSFTIKHPEGKYLASVYSIGNMSRKLSRANFLYHDLSSKVFDVSMAKHSLEFPKTQKSEIQF